jgi:hypothetical protein
VEVEVRLAAGAGVAYLGDDRAGGHGVAHAHAGRELAHVRVAGEDAVRVLDGDLVVSLVAVLEHAVVVGELVPDLADHAAHGGADGLAPAEEAGVDERFRDSICQRQRRRSLITVVPAQGRQTRAWKPSEVAAPAMVKTMTSNPGRIAKRRPILAWRTNAPTPAPPASGATFRSTMLAAWFSA